MGSKKLRLLFLAFAFPPSRAVGALRAWYMAKHLASLDWHVKVVTIHPRLLTNPGTDWDVEAECRRYGIERILTGHGMRFLYGGWLKLRPWERIRTINSILRKILLRLDFDVSVGWVRPGLKACAGLKSSDIDLILATAPPFPSFNMAIRLSNMLGVPYVLDYRDLWSQDPYRQHASGTRLIKEEQGLLESASGVMAASPGYAKSLEHGFGLPCCPEVISNGFDPEELGRVARKHYDDFSVVYAGSFYQGKRVINPVIQAIARANQLVNGCRPIRLHYYGDGGDHVSRVGKGHGATEFVTIHGSVERSEAWAAVKGSDVAAVITSVSDDGIAHDQGTIPAKLIEAIGLGSRIMLIAPRGSDAGKIVERLGAGRHFLGSQVEEMAQWLVELYRNGARQEYAGSEEFSWPNIAQKLDRYLRGVIHRHQKRISPN